MVGASAGASDFTGTSDSVESIDIAHDLFMRMLKFSMFNVCDTEFASLIK